MPFAFHPAVLSFFTYAEKLTVMFSEEVVEGQYDSVETRLKNGGEN
jgi:hypothetical protein